MAIGFKPIIPFLSYCVLPTSLFIQQVPFPPNPSNIQLILIEEESKTSYSILYLRSRVYLHLPFQNTSELTANRSDAIWKGIVRRATGAVTILNVFFDPARYVILTIPKVMFRYQILNTIHFHTC